MIAEQLPLLSHDLPPLALRDRVRTPEGWIGEIAPSAAKRALTGRGYTADGRQTELGLRKQDKFITYHPRDLAHDNIRTYTRWIETLGDAA